MGVVCCKPVSDKDDKGDTMKLQNNVPKVIQDQPFEILDLNVYEQQVLQMLKIEFRDDTETFILNQLLMCPMFFGNYQREIGICAKYAPEKEKEISSKLIQEYQKQLLMPDVILRSVCEKVKYKESNGPNNGLLKPLASQRMYILHTNIEIDDKRYLPNYSGIDKPCYRAQIEESKEHRGYVKVNLLGTPPLNSKEKRNSAGSDYSECSDNIYESKPTIDLAIDDNIASTSTGFKGTDSGFNTESDYDYTSLTVAKTPQKLDKSEVDIYTNISQLPKKCITTVQSKNVNFSDSESEEEDNTTTHRRLKEPALFVTNYFLNSLEFMIHFKDNVFANHLGDVLDFPQPFLEQATSVYGAIYCDNVDDNNNIIHYEIFPAIPMTWPDEIAFEWTLRRRATVLDKREEKPTAYKWPTEEMVKEAKKLDCVLIPKGFMPKKGTNPKMQIEWEVGFPKAERFLELRMSHAQTRVFLFLITLLKKFIEPKTKNLGLVIEHIRYLMFWECETNYKAWPEDKLGTKLKLVLKNLFNYLSKQHLPHYFIRGRNVFENIPSRYIILTIEIIQNVLESPVHHFISALKNLKYNTRKFYPEPDLDELYNIINSESVYDTNIQLSIIALEQAKVKVLRNEENQKRNKRDKEQDWDRRLLEAQRQKNLLKLMKKGSNTTDKNLTLQSQELTVSIQKRFDNDTVRQIRLLTYFIDLFIQIAKSSIKISTTDQTLLYLKQAWYLTKLLEDIDMESALSFHERIRSDEENCQRRKAKESKIPDVPKRNTFNAGEILHFKGTNINMPNLAKSYNEKIVSKPNLRTKKKPKKQHTFEKNPKRETTVAVDIHAKDDIEREDENNSSKPASSPPIDSKTTTLPTATLNDISGFMDECTSL